MPLPSFTVTGNLWDLLGNLDGSEITGNGLGGGTPATVTFTPNVPINYFVTWDGDAYRVKPVVAQVNSAGEILRNGEAVLLLANDPGLSITGLQWRVDISSMKPFWINAPTDGGTVDIATATPVPAVSVVGIASLPVSGLSDATTYAKGFLTGSTDAATARAYLGVSSSGNQWAVFANSAAFPVTGDTNTEYLAVDTGKLYRWNAGGSNYVEVSIGEPPIAAGTTAQYWRGDKTWQTLDKTAVGLGNVTNNAQYFPGGTDVALGDGGTGASLADPGADRLMFWDDSAGTMDWLTLGTNLSITGTTLNAAGGGGGSGDVVGPASSIDGEIALFDSTTGKLLKRATGSGIAKLTSGVLGTAVAGTDYYNPGGTDVAVADGGTGASTAAGARTNLGLVIGTNVQAWDADLDTWATKAPPSGAVVGTSDTQALTNKRVTPRVNGAASNATPTLDAAYDATVLTAQGAAITAFSLANSFTAEQKHMVRIKDDGTSRAITWTSSVIVPADGITLPPATTVGKTHRIGCIYDEVIGKLVAWAVGTV